MDPPDFLEYRRLLHPMFSPAATDRLEPVIETFVHRCIDEFIERGEADLVHDLADPLPAMVTLHKLGLPVDEWRRFSEPMHKTVFLRQDNPARAGVLEELAWIGELIHTTIAERRATPRDDMITYLTRGEVFGEPVSDHAVAEMVMLTLQGGLDTTGSAISNALIHLDHDRAARQRLIDEPDLLPSAVEEFLRYESPQFALARTAKRDVTIGDRQIRAGDRILLVWASGNRDEDVFERPDEVRARSLPEPSHGLRARRPPLPRLELRPPPDPARPARRAAPAPRLRARPRPPRQGGDDRGDVRDVRAAGPVHTRAPAPVLTSGGGPMADEPFVDSHIHFWDHSVDGLQWAWLKSGYTFRRWEGSDELDAPRYAPRAPHRGRRDRPRGRRARALRPPDRRPGARDGVARGGGGGVRVTGGHRRWLPPRAA